MKRTRFAGVASVFIAATLLATNVAASDSDSNALQPESAVAAQSADYEAQADTFLSLKILNVGPAQFNPGDDNNALSLASSSGACLRGTSLFYADLDLPHGSEILSVLLFANDSSSTQQITSELRQRNLAFGTSDTLMTVATGIAATPGHDTFDYSNVGTPNKVLDKNSEAFFVVVQIPAEVSTLELCNVQILYTPPHSGGLEFHQLAPCAAFDTRSGSGAFNGKLSAGETVVADLNAASNTGQGGVSGSCGVPAAPGSSLFGDTQGQVVAVALNLVALEAGRNGNLKAWRNGTAEPDGGVLTFTAGQPNSNEFAIAVDNGTSCLFPPCMPAAHNGGRIQIKNNSSTSVHVRGVILGYYTAVDSDQ